MRPFGDQERDTQVDTQVGGKVGQRSRVALGTTGRQRMPVNLPQANGVFPDTLTFIGGSWESGKKRRSGKGVSSTQEAASRGRSCRGSGSREGPRDGGGGGGASGTPSAGAAAPFLVMLSPQPPGASWAAWQEGACMGPEASPCVASHAPGPGPPKPEVTHQADVALAGAETSPAS